MLRHDKHTPDQDEMKNLYTDRGPLAMPISSKYNRKLSQYHSKPCPPVTASIHKKAPIRSTETSAAILSLTLLGTFIKHDPIRMRQLHCSSAARNCTINLDEEPGVTVQVLALPMDHSDRPECPPLLN